MAGRKRGREAAGDMVRSLGIVLAIVLFVWFFARPPHSDEKKIRVVDPTSDVQAFSSAAPDGAVRVVGRVRGQSRVGLGGCGTSAGHAPV